MSKGRNFTIGSFEIVAVCGNKVECCFDIVAGVDGALGFFSENEKPSNAVRSVVTETPSSAGCQILPLKKAKVFGSPQKVTITKKRTVCTRMDRRVAGTATSVVDAERGLTTLTAKDERELNPMRHIAAMLLSGHRASTDTSKKNNGLVHRATRC